MVCWKKGKKTGLTGAERMKLRMIGIEGEAIRRGQSMFDLIAYGFYFECTVEIQHGVRGANTSTPHILKNVL